MKLYRLQRAIDNIDSIDRTVTVNSEEFGTVTHRTSDMDVLFQDKNGVYHQIQRPIVHVLRRSITRIVPCLVLKERP